MSQLEEDLKVQIAYLKRENKDLLEELKTRPKRGQRDRKLIVKGTRDVPIKVVAEMFGVTPTGVRGWVKAGLLKAKKKAGGRHGRLFVSMAYDLSAKNGSRTSRAPEAKKPKKRQYEVITEGFKPCNTCRKVKGMAAFWIDRGSKPDGRMNICISCAKKKYRK